MKSSSLISRVYTYPQKIDNANDSDSRKQPHITVIKVSKDESFEEMGVGEYSELSLSRVPSMTANHLEQDPHICHASFAKTADLKLVKSNSFIYAAKESGYAKIKRSPSVNTYVNNDVRDLAAANRNKAETGIQNSTRPSYIEPVYEDMPMENVSDKESTPALPNGFHKSHSETDSLATNSLSSMSTTPTNTSGSMSMTKVYPVTSVHGDKTDIKQNEKLVRKMSLSAILYKEQVNEVITKLDKLLDAESAGKFLSCNICVHVYRHTYLCVCMHACVCVRNNNNI